MLWTDIKTVGIDHAVLEVTDLECSKRFYMDLLGMTVTPNLHGSRFSGAANSR